MENNTIGARIKERRKAMGLTQEQLAEILYTKKVTISAYENDRIDLKVSQITELARVLKCSGAYLLEGSQSVGVDDRILNMIANLKSDQIKEVALKQLEALASL